MPRPNSGRRVVNRAMGKWQTRPGTGTLTEAQVRARNQKRFAQARMGLVQEAMKNMAAQGLGAQQGSLAGSPLAILYQGLQGNINTPGNTVNPMQQWRTASSQLANTAGQMQMDPRALLAMLLTGNAL